MYNHTLIKEALRGLVGFESSYNLDHPAVDTDLLASSSGIYVNHLHPLLTYDNILTIAEQFSAVSVRAYDGAKTYKLGDIVKEGANVFQSLQNDNVGNDTADVAWWRPTTLLSAYLRKVYDSASVKLFNRLFTEKKLNEAAKTLLESSTLYEGVGNLSGRITKTDRMAGYKITLNHKDTAAIISQIGLQLDTPQADVKLYLYHSSSSTPLKEFVLNHTSSLSLQWHQLVTPEVLNGLSSLVAGGSYYLVYYEDELDGLPVEKKVSFSGNYAHCGTCSSTLANKKMYANWSPYVRIQPFYVNAESLPVDGTLWDHDQEIYEEDTTLGINLQLAVKCDVTEVVIRSKEIVTDALSQQLVVDLLNEMAFSTRDNQLKQKVAGLAAIALDNGENGQTGEMKKLRESIKALSFDLSGMSSVCLKCDGVRQQIKIKSMWR